MNSIADLLINNIGAVIVIAVAAVSLLGKMKSNIGNPAGKRPMAPMPSFGGGPGERELPKPEVKPKRDWESQEGLTLEGETGRTTVSDSPRAAENPPGFAAGAAVSNTALAPDKEDLRRAVLWAEILGPPRAKRPHGR